ALAGHFTFDIPQKSGQLDEARAELEKCTVQREELHAGVKLEIEKIYGDLNDALTRSREQTEGQRSARRWATGAYANFDVGTGDTRELTDAFTALAFSTALKAVAYHDAQVGLSALSRAAGVERADIPMK